jgi:hypothetical protein
VPRQKILLAAGSLAANEILDLKYRETEVNKGLSREVSTL